MSKLYIEYEYSVDAPFYCKLMLDNQSVIVGEAAGSSDLREFEIIDGYNGKQLAFLRITDDEYTTAQDLWSDLMMKAHCELLTLQQIAVEQASRDNQFNTAVQEAEGHLASMIQMNGAGRMPRKAGVTAQNLENMRNAVNRLSDAYDRLSDAYDLMDDAYDPDT